MFRNLIALAAGSLGVSLARSEAADNVALGGIEHAGRRYPAGWAAFSRSRFDPKVNRNTGKPHEHRREIARRLRQQEKLAGRSPGGHMG